METTASAAITVGVLSVSLGGTALTVQRSVKDAGTANVNRKMEDVYSAHLDITQMIVMYHVH